MVLSGDGDLQSSSQSVLADALAQGLLPACLGPSYSHSSCCIVRQRRACRAKRRVLAVALGELG